MEKKLNLRYLNNEVWISTHQKQKLIKEMEQQIYHVITCSYKTPDKIMAICTMLIHNYYESEL